MVSMCAFGAAALQTFLMQRQQHASVWPYLELGFYITGSDGFKITLTNKGVGPAIVKEVDIQYKGQQYDRLEKVAKQILQDTAFNYSIYSTNPPDNRVFAPGESLIIFNVKPKGYAARLSKSTDQINIKIRYASVFGQKWETDGQQTTQLE